MFAIIRTGGKQYKVQPDQVITVERLPGDTGDILSFETVLMVGEGDTSHVGHPFLTGSVVKASILEQIRAEKIIIFKKRRRHNYRRKQGHRQNQSVLRIIEISGPNGLKAVGNISENTQKFTPLKVQETDPKEISSPSSKSASKKPISKVSAPKASESNLQKETTLKKTSPRKEASKKDTQSASPKA